MHKTVSDFLVERMIAWDVKRIFGYPGDVLERYAPEMQIPELSAHALVHGHCHHKAVMHMDADMKIMKKLGLKCTVPDSGCCGMAGYFGYVKGEAYRVSVQAGERLLLPEVRKAGDTMLILADGFSCREQIQQETGKKALHLAEVIDRAMQQDIHK